MKTSYSNLFILVVGCSLLVQAQRQCSCGCLGSGTNPCTCSETVVKAAKLPTPTCYVSPQEIKDAVEARNRVIVLPPDTGRSNLQSSKSISCSDSDSTVYSNTYSNAYSNSNSNAYSSSSSSSGSSVVYSDSTAYSTSSSSSGSPTVYSDSKACGCSSSSSSPIVYSDANAYSSSASSSGPTVVYSDSGAYSSSSSSSGPNAVYSESITYTNPSSSDSSNTGCDCNKQIADSSSESLNIDDSTGTVVPRFSPVGDLCYPIKSRSENIIERTKVIPAYPGKITCNKPVPNEICLNTMTGEMRTRTLTSDDSSTSESEPIVYSKPNVAASSGSLSGTFTTIGKTGAVSESIPRILSGLKSGPFGNLNSRLFGNLKSGTYSSSNFGSFGSKYDIYSSPSSTMHTNPNVANGQKQYGKIIASNGFSDCDDDTEVDYSYPEIPADAVSLTIAYKNLRAPNVIYRQGKQFVPEDKLSFGHRTVPNDAKTDRKVSDIPEEKLVTVEKPVVELKIAPPRTVVIGSYDEREEAKLAELEAIERESITQEGTADQVAESLITYKDLGYAPVGTTFTKSGKYNEMVSREIDDSLEEPCGPLGPPIPDYVPGSIVVKNAAQTIPDCFGNGEVSDSITIQRTNYPRFRSSAM